MTARAHSGRTTRRAGYGAARRERQNGHGGSRNGSRAVDLRPLNGSIGYTVRRAQMALFADFATSLREVNLRPNSAY